MTACTIQDNISLRQLHSFAMPAVARQLMNLEHVEQLYALHADHALHNDNNNNNLSQVPKIILGEGTNTIFLEDYSALILKINLKGISIDQSTAEWAYVTAAAGENWDEFVHWAIQHQLYGLENLSLIPGQVGAAPVQNIGAYGVEVADCIARIHVYDFISNQTLWLTPAECGFNYRESKFKRVWQQRYCILAVTFKLQRTFQPIIHYGELKQLFAEAIESPTASQVRQAVINIRQKKLPDYKLLPNAGSFFKNPVINKHQFEQLIHQFPAMPSYPLPNKQYKIPAAWLLDQQGFKGFTLGSFGCAATQPLVLIHYKQPHTKPGHTNQQPPSLAALTCEFVSLVKTIQNTIAQHYAIHLEIEPNLITSQPISSSQG